MAYCEAPDCVRPAEPGRRYCAGHRKRLQRGKSLTPLAETDLDAAELHQRACDAYLNAETDEEFERTRAAWIRTACLLAQSLGWRAPLVKRRPLSRVDELPLFEWLTRSPDWHRPKGHRNRVPRR